MVELLTSWSDPYSRYKVRISKDQLYELLSCCLEESGGEALHTAASVDEEDHIFRTPYTLVIPGSLPHVKLGLVFRS